MTRISVFIMATLFATSAAHALDEAAPDGSREGASPDQIESVTVSARRRDENAQSVPIPISVLAGEALERAGQFRLEELNQRLPSTNVQFGNPRQTSVAVRGLGNNPANDALESSVGVYLDNVYLGRPGMANLDLIDLDQIALLRGPQGTLFGKNTTAGVLNLQTQLPTFESQYKVETSGGDYGYYQVRGAASGPLIGDELAGRISVARSHKDGFVDDVFDGRRLNGYQRDGVRGQLLYKPGETFSLRLIGDYNREDSDCCASALYNLGPNGGAAYLALVNSTGGAIVLDPKYRQVTLGSPQHMSVNQGGGSAEANWQLGNFKLTSISAYRNWRFVPTNDADGMNIDAITNAGQAVNDEQWSQEVRLASPVGRAVEYVGGLYYFYQHQNNQLYTYYGPDAGKFTRQVAFNNGTTTTSQFLGTNSVATFVQATWNATDRLSLTGGARETYEDKSTRFHRNDPIGSAGFQAAFPVYESGRLERHDSNASALISSSFKFSDGILGYASVARGAKAGGINPQVPTGGLTTESLFVNPETATDYELGIKTTAFDRRLQFNANVFLADVKDYQATQLAEVSTGVFVQVLSNIGKVRSQGVELELQAVPVQGFKVSLNGSYNDALYRSYANAPCSSEKIAAGLKVCDLTGSQVVGAPKWIVSSGLDYEHTLGNSLQAFGGVSYSWRSTFFGSADNSELARVKAYGILNLRAGLGGDWGTNRWTASLWATNLTDEVYTVGGITSASSTLQYSEFPGAPRSIGATLRLDF